MLSVECWSCYIVMTMDLGIDSHRIEYASITIDQLIWYEQANDGHVHKIRKKINKITTTSKNWLHFISDFEFEWTHCLYTSAELNKMQQIHTLQHFRIHSDGNMHIFVIGLAFDNDNIKECAREWERESKNELFN